METEGQLQTIKYISQEDSYYGFQNNNTTS